MEKFVEERLIVRWIGVLHQRTIDNTDTQITGKTQSLLNEVENNIDGFPGSAYEAQRVADFAEADDVTQVTIEPAPAGTSFDQIDLRVSTQGEAGDTYIELKRAQTEERNAVEVADKFEASNNKFRRPEADEMINFNEDTTKVEIDARAGFKEDVTIDDIKSDLETKLDGIGNNDVKIQEVVISMPDSFDEEKLVGIISNGEFEWET